MFKRMFSFGLVFLIMLALSTESVFAQLNLKNIKKRTEKKIEKRVEKKIDKEIDKGLDKIEESLEDDSSEQGSSQPQTQQKQQSKPSSASTHSESATHSGSAPSHSTELSWARYDFIPGDEIFFEDDFRGERNGEFPSKWDLVRGMIEIVQIDGENSIIIRGDGNMHRGGIVPLIKNPKEDYLPDEFTIEFDAFFKAGQRNQTYMILLYDRKNQSHISGSEVLHINFASAKYGKILGVYPGYNENSLPQADTWRHIAISFNVRALKVYIDDARVLNIPNININPTGITLSAVAFRSSPDMNFVKNFRMAKGAVPLYQKAMTEGRIVTRGIVFDVNKAIIKPESMGVINEIFRLMKENPDISFIIEGHTDSDGDPSRNITLSEQRAIAIKAKLVELGIDSSRLETKGMGASNPVADNTTAEGKAQNRRVEFVRK